MLYLKILIAAILTFTVSGHYSNYQAMKFCQLSHSYETCNRTLHAPAREAQRGENNG